MRWVIILLLFCNCLYGSEKLNTYKKEYSFYKSSNIEVQHGSYQLFNSENTLLVSGNYNDGIKEGKWLAWHSNGNIAKQESFSKGIINGYLLEWHENSEKATKREFFKGNEHGVSHRWHDNNTLKEEVIWRNGAKHGFAKAWFASGNMHKKTFYKNHEIHGYSYEWNDMGKLIGQKFFINGRELKLKLRSDKYASGIMKLAYTYYIDKDNQEIKHGKYNKWFPNGESWIECRYFHDKIHGKWVYGKREGLHSREEAWHFGVKHGTFIWWAQGKKIKTEEWYEGKRISLKELE
jgi:uncharacterized protein